MRKRKDNCFFEFLTNARKAIKEPQSELDFKTNVLSYLQDYITNEKFKDLKSEGARLLEILQSLSREIIQIPDSSANSSDEKDSKSELNCDEILTKSKSRSEDANNPKLKDFFSKLIEKICKKPSLERRASPSKRALQSKKKQLIKRSLEKYVRREEGKRTRGRKPKRSQEKTEKNEVKSSKSLSTRSALKKLEGNPIQIEEIDRDSSEKNTTLKRKRSKKESDSSLKNGLKIPCIEKERPVITFRPFIKPAKIKKKTLCSNIKLLSSVDRLKNPQPHEESKTKAKTQSLRIPITAVSAGKAPDREGEKSPEYVKRTDLGISFGKGHRGSGLGGGERKRGKRKLEKIQLGDSLLSKKEEKLEELNKANKGFLIKEFRDPEDVSSPVKLQFNNTYLLQLDIEDKARQKEDMSRQKEERDLIDVLEEGNEAIVGIGKKRKRLKNGRKDGETKKMNGVSRVNPKQLDLRNPLVKKEIEEA